MSTKTALISGGAKGIGRAVALRLAEQGWSVSISYRTSEEAARETVEKIRALGAQAIAVRADVAQYDECERYVRETADELGEIDALINGAGPYHRVPILEETPEGWREMMQANLDSAFFLTKLVAPGMVDRGWGRIVYFSMANADRMIAQTQVTAHYIAKAGVLILTRSFAKQLASNGITVNAISPGFIDSGSAPPEELERMRGKIPAGYVGELSDAVAAVEFLLGQEARYVNGTNLHLSGGWGV